MLNYKTYGSPKSRELTIYCPSTKSRCQGSSGMLGVIENTYTWYVKTKNIIDSGECMLRVEIEQCCRNYAITNMKEKGDDFFTFAEINICQPEFNNSINYKELPIAILPVGEPQIINYGGEVLNVDSTGKALDSVYYSFAEPLKSSSVKNEFSGSYTFDKPIYYLGFPKDNLIFPRGFKLDSLTGLLAFMPMKREVSIYSIRVEAFRRGKKISETRREIQTYIIKLQRIDYDIETRISSLIPTNGKNDFDSEIYNLCVGQQHDFDLKCYLTGSKLDSTDTLFHKVETNIKDLKIQGANGNYQSWIGTASWKPTKNDIGKKYYIKLYAKVNTCPFRIFEYDIIEINVTNDYFKVPLPKINIEYVDSVCNVVQFSHNTPSSNYSKFIWQLNDDKIIKAGIKNDTNTFTVQKDTNLIKTTVYQNGCSSVVIDTFIAKPGYIKIDPLDSVIIDCHQNDSFYFEQKIAASGGNGTLKYSWGGVAKTNNLKLLPSNDETIKLWHNKNLAHVDVYYTVTDSTNCKVYDKFYYVARKSIDYKSTMLADSLLESLVADSIHCSAADTFVFKGSTLNINYINGLGIDKDKRIFTPHNLPAGKHTLKYQQIVLNSNNTPECLYANINHYVGSKPNADVENPIELCPKHGEVELDQFIIKNDGSYEFSGDYINQNKFSRVGAQYKEQSKYYYTYTDSLYCTVKDSGLIKISNNVSYLDLGIDTILCKEPNSLHKLPIPSNIKTAKGSWTLSKGVKIEHDSIQIPLSSLNNYKVEFIGFDSLNCQGIASREFTVNSRPDGLIDNSLLPTKLCLSKGDTLNLIASPDDGFWQINNDQIIQNDTAIVIMDSILIGSKNYSYTIFRNGCPGTKNKAITLNPNPTILTIPDDTICYVGIDFTHPIKNPNPSGLYTGPRLVNNSGIAISDQNDREAEYLFQLFTTEGCTTETKFKILVNSANPIFKIKEDSIPTNTEVVLLRFDNNSYNRHTWYFGNGDTSMQTNPKYEYKKAGNYTITHKIENNLCLQTDSQFIKVYSNVSVPSRLNVSLDVYPNPTDGKIQIHGLNSQADVYFYNLQGKQLSSYSLSKGNNAIDISNNAKGVYMYRIVMSDGKFQTGLIELR